MAVVDFLGASFPCGLIKYSLVFGACVLFLLFVVGLRGFALFSVMGGVFGLVIAGSDFGGFGWFDLL